MGEAITPCTPACGHWDLKLNKLNRLRESEVTLLGCWDRGSICSLSFWLELSPGGCWGSGPCTAYKVLMLHWLPLVPPLFLACERVPKLLLTQAHGRWLHNPRYESPVPLKKNREADGPDQGPQQSPLPCCVCWLGQPESKHWLLPVSSWKTVSPHPDM